MENASKALLIAGSVLIVILLIAMGMKIFRSQDDMADQVETNVQTTELLTFNNKFYKYAGKQKGTQVKALINDVIAHNATEEVRKVKINEKTNPGDISSLLSNIDSMKEYTVTVTTDPSTGYVNSISYN